MYGDSPLSADYRAVMDMLRIEKNRVSHFFDGSAIPAAYAKSGEMVVFCCQDCYNDQLKDGEDLRKKHIAHYNPQDHYMWKRRSRAMCSKWRYAG